MKKNDHFFRFGLVGTMVLLMAFAFSGFAQPDINNSTWTGWTDRGSSYAIGVYASGTKSSDYQIYTTVFIYDNANPVPTQGPATSWNGFTAGHRIMGIGIRNNSGTTASPSINLDPNNNSFYPSPDGITGGAASFSVNGDPGDAAFNTSSGNPIEITIRNSGTLSAIGPPQVYTGGTAYYCPNGGNWCGGLGQPGFRGINPSTGVWKVFFDLDQMTTEFASGGTRNATGPYLGAFHSTLTFSVTGGSTRAVVQNISTAVPVFPVRVYTDNTLTTLVSSHATIQAAINAGTTLSGYAIDVDAGTYTEALLINKSLTILGPNAAVSPNGGSRVAEAIIDLTGGSRIKIATNDITLKGFKIVNLNQQGAIISGGGLSGTTAAANVTIEKNLFDNLTGNAIYTSGSISNWTITDNKIQNVSSYTTGGTYGSGMGFWLGASNLTITNNTISNVAWEGIQFVCYVTSASNILVKNNTITNILHSGMNIASNLNNVDVIDNAITNANTTTTANEGGIIIQGLGTVVDAVISGNTISGSYNGIYVLTGFDLTGKDLVVNNNDLSGNANKSINNAATGTLNATCNWYGTVNLAALAATVQGPVTYQPVLNSGTDTDPAIGFQPAPGTCQYICPLITVAMTGTNASCNGTATATPSGGTAPYTYLWSNGSTAQTITNVPAGTYTVTVTDANNCTGTGSRTITGSSPINPITTQVNVSCFGGNNGSITVTGAGGSALTPWTYNLNGSPFQNSNVFSNLAAGVYIVGLKDANGCSDFVTRTITELPLLTVTTSSIQSTCFGQNTGAIIITASGGKFSKTYSWTGPNGYTSSVKNPSNLSAGNYSVLVTDENGCTAELNNVTVASFGEIIVNSSITNILCRGSFTGAIDLTVSGGTGSGFTYNWTGAVASTNEDLSNLGASTNYRVRITDAGSGCFVDRIFTVTQPNLLSVNTAFTNVTGCNSLGSITATGAGGTSPYEYNINGGAYQLSNVFTGLSAGSYTIGIRDANGCTALSTLRTISDFINDAYESNNISSASKPISIGTAINARISVATDADWFVITTPAGGGPISYSLVVTHPILGYTFDMYPASPNNAAALTPTSVIGTTQKDYLLAPGTSYRIRVTNSSVSSVCYQLSVNPTIIPPAAEITQAGAATNQSQFQVAVVDDLNVKAFPNPHRGRFSLQIVSPVSGDARIELFNINGQKLQEKKLGVLQSAKNIVPFQLSNNGAVFYKVQIGKYYSTGKILGVE
jgi:hypothetical protein